MSAALGATHHEPAHLVLIAALSSDDPTTRQVAAWALKTLGTSTAIEPLSQAAATETDAWTAKMMRHKPFGG